MYSELRPAKQAISNVAYGPRAKSRWRVYAAVSLAIFVAGAMAAAVKFAALDRQEFTGVIQHTPLPPSETGKHLLPVSDLRSLAGLAKTPAILGPAAEVAGTSPQSLLERVELRPALGSQTLTLSLRWPVNDHGATVLNSLMTEIVRHSSDLRRRRLDDRSADLQKAITASDADVNANRAVLVSLYRRAGTSDLPLEIRTASSSIDALGVSLAQTIRTAANSRAQLVEADTLIARLTKTENSLGTAPNILGSKLTWLEFMVDQNRLSNGADALLDAKMKELEAMRRVYQQGAAGWLEVVRLEGEANYLKTRAKDDTEIRKMKEQLASLVHSSQPPELQQATTKRRELQFILTASENEIPLLEAEQKRAAKRLDRLLAFQLDSAPLVRDVERAENERNRLQAQCDQLRTLRSVAGDEAVVLQSAGSPVRSYAAFRSWIAPATAFGMTLVLLFAAFSGLRGRTSVALPRTPEEVDLPVLANVHAYWTDNETTDPGVRSLAFALRQRLPRAGAAILFTPLRQGNTLDIVLRTAATLARRDERVLVVDAALPGRRHSEAPSALRSRSGLSNYLAFEVIDPYEAIEPTPIGGVDLMPVGSAIFSSDDLATHRMRELMGSLRQTYSIILVNGPVLGMDPTEIHILCAYQDGTVVLGDANAPVPEGAYRLLRDYRQIGVPLIGYVTIAG